MEIKDSDFFVFFLEDGSGRRKVAGTATSSVYICGLQALRQAQNESVCRHKKDSCKNTLTRLRGIQPVIGDLRGPEDLFACMEAALSVAVNSKHRHNTLPRRLAVGRTVADLAPGGRPTACMVLYICVLYGTTTLLDFGTTRARHAAGLASGTLFHQPGTPSSVSPGSHPIYCNHLDSVHGRRWHLLHRGLRRSISVASS